LSWFVRNKGPREAKVTVVVLGYIQASTSPNPPPAPNPTNPPPAPPAPTPVPPAPTPVPPRDIDTSPTPVSQNGRYDVGSPTLTNLWVDPVSGSDSQSGATRQTALRTITAAWQRIPANTTLSTGYRIQLVAGTYATGDMPHYWENRRGTYTHPVILNAADGAHSATLRGDINMYNTAYFYLTGVDIKRDGDAFHCEQCSYTLIRDSALNGDVTPSGDKAHETIKINQSDHVFIEDSQISGADDNAIDFVAVQYGHLLGNKVSAANDWCGYAKGGSAYLTVEGNEFFDCGTGGFTAGQGTGIEFMTAPWIHYEALGIRIVNNLIHDTDGAGLGVNGGYNILLAYNTMYRVGQRSHVAEFVFGLHSCDGAPSNTADCATRTNAGGWGTTGTSEAWIPNRHVYFYNNVIYNPSGYQSQWQHLAVYGARNQPGAATAPDPARTDDDLRIAGNVIWNGGQDMALGIDGDSGCRSNNPTCTASKVTNENWINAHLPEFADPAGLDFTPDPSGWLANQDAVAIPAFDWSDRPAVAIPVGTTDNSVPTDRAGDARSGWGRPGAY